jgi:asparagine synthase (glutamine-hydrolysing)
MCGIFGLIDTARSIPEDLTERLIRVQNHRGPDDHGVHAEEGVLLGMNRLAIIDIDTGHQPIFNEDGSLLICFNGEIYNYLELRRELIDRGHAFSTRTDTEVVLHAFEEWGSGCLIRFNGMFAFAIWNRRSGECFLARDRLGIKPLYYAARQGRLCFASELKTMLQMVEDTGGLDTLALSRFFSFWYVPTPQTPFKGISKLRPGHFLRFINGETSISRWWNIELGQSEGVAMTEVEAVAMLRDILFRAVGMELMSDVPLGCFLSGGVDSSAVVAFAQQALGRQVKTFCYRFQESTHDESADARIVAEHLGTEHHEILVDRQAMLSALEDLPQTMDEPFGDSTFISLLLLSREVRRHVTVSLTGMGGDEVFTGYPTIRGHRYMSLYRRLPVALRQGLIPAVVNRLPVSDKYFSLEFKAKRFIRGQDQPPEIQHFQWMENFTFPEKKALLGDFAPETSLEETYAPVLEELTACDAHETMNRILFLDARFFLENNGLFQVDRASMANSLEARVPLLNTLVLDFLAEVPFSLKYRRGELKRLLRQAVRKDLPARVFAKPKKGFAPPVSSWLRTVYREMLVETLSPAALRTSPLSGEVVGKMIVEHLGERYDHGRALWMLLVFQLWWKTYA